MDNYIVRLYRRDADNPENLVGLVETVGEEGKQPFHNVSELMLILAKPHPMEISVPKPALRLVQAGKKKPR